MSVAPMPAKALRRTRRSPRSTVTERAELPGARNVGATRAAAGPSRSATKTVQPSAARARADRLADAGAAAGDECDATVQIEVHLDRAACRLTPAVTTF